MTPNEAQVQAAAMMDRAVLTITQARDCRKGHWPCWQVQLVLSTDTGKGELRRYIGAFEHHSLAEAFDTAACVAAHFSSALELFNAREELQLSQLTLDV